MPMMNPPPLHEGLSANPCDAYLLKILAGSPSLRGVRMSAVESWWLAECQPRENLAAFMVRQGVFIPEACKAVEVRHANRVPFQDGEQFLAAQGLQILRERCGSAEPEPESATPSTGDMLAATDTLLDRPDSQEPGDATDDADPEETPNNPGLPNLHIGCVLGKCLLTRQLGQGTSGVVFQALHTGLNIPVAVKVLPRHVLDHDGSIYRQFRTEAAVLGQLNHPHIIRLLDFQDDAELPYLVLEYIEGLTLAELIHQSGRLRLDRAVKIIAQVAEGLAAARKCGVVHRDVKPGNILLARDGKAKLADLGLALVSSDRLHGGPAPVARMAGTAGYVAPEQALNAGGIDHRSDIYALGATFYHAVTGQFPFTGRSAREVMLKHLQEEAVPPHLLVPGLDPAVSNVILTMMAKEPGQRFQEYEQLLKALAELTPKTPPAAAAASGRSFGSSGTMRPPGGSTQWQQSGSLLGHLGKVGALAFAPDGKLLASGSVDRTIRLWDPAAGKELAALTGHGAEVAALAFAPDGKVLASAGPDRTVRLWEVDGRSPWATPRATLRGYASDVGAVAFAPDGRLLATACADGSVKLWDLSRKRLWQVLHGHTQVVTGLSFAPDGRTLATASGDETVRLWEVATGRERLLLRGHKFGVSSVRYAPGGTTLASGSWDMTVKLWDAIGGRDRATLQGHAASVRDVAYSPDGRLLASASWDKTVKVWDLSGGLQLVASLGHAREVNAVVFAPSGQQLATGSDDGTLKILDVNRDRTGRVTVQPRGPKAV
jgi:WD40 repeat protein